MASDTQRHILLTGFEPFDGDTVNPSGEVAKVLDGHVIGDCVVRSAVLPVQHEAARAIIVPSWKPPASSGRFIWDWPVAAPASRSSVLG